MADAYVFRVVLSIKFYAVDAIYNYTGHSGSVLWCGQYISYVDGNYLHVDIYTPDFSCQLAVAENGESCMFFLNTLVLFLTST